MHLYVFLQFALLFVLAAASPLKCPHGQIWIEDTKSCGKFGRIVSGSQDGILKEDSHGNKSCQGDLMWVPSHQICAQKPRICKNAACTEEKVPKSAEDCPENKPWNENHKKCERPKQVESKFGVDE